MTSKINDAQREFDERYISSTEMMASLGVTRTTILLARRTGKLPDPIDIQGKIFIWERDKVTPYLDAWKIILDARRGAGA
jgi:predicted DNA-binding transcriptional regulator AlpA